MRMALSTSYLQSTIHDDSRKIPRVHGTISHRNEIRRVSVRPYIAHSTAKNCQFQASIFNSRWMNNRKLCRSNEQTHQQQPLFCVRAAVIIFRTCCLFFLCNILFMKKTHKSSNKTTYALRCCAPRRKSEWNYKYLVGRLRCHGNSFPTNIFRLFREINMRMEFGISYSPLIEFGFTIPKKRQQLEGKWHRDWER